MISNWTNMVARKNLLRELIATELKASTAQTKLGWLWWLLDPLLMMVIYWTIVVELFGRGGVQYAPYWLYLYFGLVTWKHFGTAATRASTVLSAKKGLIQSVAFPTMVLPLASSISNFAFFLFGFATLLGMALLVPLPLHSGSLLPAIQVPFLMAFQLLIVAGISLPLACLGAVYRDFAGLVPHILRLGFYLSPGLYGVDQIHDSAFEKLGPTLGFIVYHVYMLNPFAVLISGYRDALFYGRFMSVWYWPQLAIQSALFLWVGYRIYQHYDRRVIKFL